MIITGRAHFQDVCKRKFAEWYNQNGHETVNVDDVSVIWYCCPMSDYTCVLSMPAKCRGIRAEYTYSAKHQVLYEEVYKKTASTIYVEE